MKKITLVLAALAAGIMMMAAAAPASAQPAPPQLPTEPTDEAPPIPDIPDDTAKPASRVTGTTARWSRSTRTLHVNVSCERSGAVIVSRNGNRIGRKAITCSANRDITVPVRITRSANRNLHVGARVTARVNSGSQHHSKRLRVVRATTSNARVASLAATAPNFLGCSNWYQQSKVGGFWTTNSWWWEFYCAYDGLQAWGSHTGWRWDYYFWNGNNQQYYGSWFRPAGNPECWYWWNAGDLRYYQAGAAGCIPL